MNEPRPLPGQMPGIRPAVSQPSHGLQPPHSVAPKVAVMPTMKVDDADLDPISLVDEPAALPNAAPHVSKIKAFMGAGPTGASHAYKRQPTVTGHGAVRVRSFHGRLSDEGMQFMDDKINEWIDLHPDIEIKFVTTQIGQFEGKIREPALIVNIWY